MKRKTDYMPYVAIIAIVAVVAVVLLVLNGNKLSSTGEASRRVYFSEIKVVEDATASGSEYYPSGSPSGGGYTRYYAKVACPLGYQIISGQCDPQHSLWLYPSHDLLRQDNNAYYCEFVSETVEDAVIAARAVCVR